MSVQTDAKLMTKGAELYLQPSCEVKHEEKFTFVKTENVEKFIERKDFLLSPFEYERNGNDPGLVLIFNQERFDTEYLNRRTGSRRDVNEIITCMSRLGFNINENHVFNDYKREEILKTVSDITKENLSQMNCLIVFVLTHGDSYNDLYASDTKIQTHEIWKDFIDCSHLKNKPKMFIFQACKGENSSSISSQTDEDISLVPDDTFKSDYIGPDMLVVYSTTEGNVSYRETQTGTWFIQELCKNFLAYGRRDDVISLIMRTAKCLGRNYFHHKNEKILKQMPIFVSTLRKKFYLNRSKDRNVVYSLLKRQENMLESINELEKKVAELLALNEKRNK